MVTNILAMLLFPSVTTADILGWIGTFCFSVCGAPQALKVYQDGHSNGLSLAFLWLWLIGEIFFVSAILLRFGFVSWLLVNYGFNLLFLLVLFRYKFWPRKRGE